MADNNNRDGSRKGKDRRGFASMDPAKQREIASKGGKASHRGDNSRSSGRDDNNDEE